MMVPSIWVLCRIRPAEALDFTIETAGGFDPEGIRFLLLLLLLLQLQGYRLEERVFVPVAAEGRTYA